MTFRSTASMLLISATLLSCFHASAQTLPARTQEAAIRELLDMTGSGKLGVQVANQLLPNLKKMTPDVDQKFWDKFMSSINADELVEMVIPIYAKHFSLDEIEQLIAFYKTPMGQKLIKEQPAIMQESMLVGQAWGLKLGQRAMEQIKAEKMQQPNL